MLDLQQLRYFVSVAELEHVGRAAEQLHVSQSPLSRRIMQLERQLGVTLFERARQRIRLTAEGRDFLEEARRLLAQAAQVEAHGRRLAEGGGGTLAIGYVEGAVHSGVLSAALRRFGLQRPGVRVRLKSARSGMQADEVRQRGLDLGFVYSPPPADDKELASRRVLDEPLLLALPATDPLAERADIGPDDLDGRTWITVVRRPDDTNRAQFLAACARAGFTPDIAYETADPLTSLGLVSAGLGLATVQQSLRAAAPKDVRFRDIPWYDRRVAVHLIWRRADSRPVVAAFRAALEAAQSPR